MVVVGLRRVVQGRGPRVTFYLRFSNVVISLISTLLKPSTTLYYHTSKLVSI